MKPWKARRRPFFSGPGPCLVRLKFFRCFSDIQGIRNTSAQEGARPEGDSEEAGANI
jgi:hypothetical protein